MEPLGSLHGAIQQLTVHLVAVGLLPELRGPPQVFWLFQGRGLLDAPQHGPFSSSR